MANGPDLVFAPLGGVGEIGMNLALYGIGDGGKRTWMVVDIGVSFAGDDLPGVDLVMPDIAFLIEGETVRDRSIVVAGIGVNCAHHPADIGYPVTDLAANGAVVTPAELMRCLSRTMRARLAQWDLGLGFAAIRAEWLIHAAGIGGNIRVRLADRELHGRFESLDRIGRLMLRMPGGNLEAITVGEVFAPIPPGAAVAVPIQGEP